MRVMHHFTICCAALAIVGCSKPDDAADTDAAAPAATPEPAAPKTISLADVAGKWEVTARPQSGSSDTTVTRYTLTTTADTTGWSIAFPGRSRPVPLHVIVGGDSIITHAGPFESVRRKGVQVTTETVARVDGNRMTGTTVARYKTSRPDSVLRLTIEGTRAP